MKSLKNTKLVNKNFLIFLAPNFLKMGIDLIDEYKKNNSNSKIYVLCHGPREVYNTAKKYLTNKISGIWDIEEFEKNCSLNDDINYEEIDNKMGKGYLAKIISSDRSIGYGFVRGSIPRESHLKEKVQLNSFEYPSIISIKLFEFIEKIIQDTKPQIVFCYAVASAASLIVSDLCKKNNVFYTTIKSTRIKDYFFIDTHYMTAFEEIQKEYNIKNRIYFDKEKASEIYFNFINQPTMPSYQIRKISFIRKNQFTIMFLKLLKNFLKFMVSYISSKNYEFFRLKRSYMEFIFSLKKMLISKKTFRDTLPKNKKFIYFSLQVEPEASTSIFSPHCTDQISVVEGLAKAAPSDMFIIVKENMYMLGRRSNNYYKILKNHYRALQKFRHKACV